ncbi:MAG: translocation/assembly module TamB domain-containing protein, partial [Gemmatimonadota bacterium]
ATELAVKLEGRRLRLRNELVDLRFGGALELSGTARRPVLAGRLVGQGGSLRYLDHTFAIERAAAVFDSPRPLPSVDALFHNPRAVDPELSLAANAALTARNGNEMRVSMALAGRVSDLQFTLASDPPRGQADVLSLLAFGEEGVPMMDDTGLYLQGRTSLSPRYLLAATEAQFGRVLGLDQVSIDASALRPGQLSGSRIVLSKQVSDKVEMTYSAAVGYAAQGRVQLQYDLGRNLYLQTERDAQGESGIDLNLKLEFK